VAADRTGQGAVRAAESVSADGPAREDARAGDAELGGEAACWAHLVCPGCGAMEAEGHTATCPARGAAG
jgi:hypothetical protein